MTKVLIVDDSAVVRKILTEELSRHEDIVVAGSAPDPYVARDKIAILKPDVITLDLEMPRMDGLTFLSKLMAHYPIPVVIVTSFSETSRKLAVKALEMGAIDVVEKPQLANSTAEFISSLTRAIRTAAASKVSKFIAPYESAPAKKDHRPLKNFKSSHRIIAIGASTGGPQAIETILKALPRNVPAMVMVQHMPEKFTEYYAKRLNEVCAMEVREAKDFDQLSSGLALLAPGGKHMIIKRNNNDYYVRVKDGPMVHHQKPSVDVLFESVAASAGENAAGVILTGMGSDGARGLLLMKSAGCYTVAQDEATSMVFGMPKEAIALDAASRILPLERIAPALIKHFDISFSAAS